MNLIFSKSVIYLHSVNVLLFTDKASVKFFIFFALKPFQEKSWLIALSMILFQSLFLS